VISKGSDASKLGRWSWTKYKGKANHTLCIISAYRPNPPTGPFSVYAQQNAYNSIDSPRCPRAAFVEDLKNELIEFIEEKDNIILMLDENCNMKQGDLVTMLESLNMRELILAKHGKNGPSTFKRNSQRVPIDGLWGTLGISIEAGGYFHFDEVFVKTDHRCLWMDISFGTAFGHNMPPLFRPQAHRLHCRDPRLIDNFIHLYHRMTNKCNLFQQVREFESTYRTLPLSQVQEEYERLDSIQCKVTEAVEAKCRKLRKGNVAFSPILNATRLQVQAWNLVLCKFKGQKVSSRLISRSLKKANLSQDFHSYSSEQIQEFLKEAYKSYYEQKGQATSLRSTALETLAEAIAKKWDKEKQRVLKDLRQREQQRSTIH